MDDANETAAVEGAFVTPPVAVLAPVPDYSTLPPARPPTPMGVVAVVAVKIVALYCVVQALPFIYIIPANLILLFSGRASALDIVLNMLDPAMYLLAGFVLVKHATWVATRVLGFEAPSDEPRAHAPGRRLQAVAFSVLGIWLVVEAAVEAVRLFVQARADASDIDNDVVATGLRDPAAIAAVVLRLALGVALFFGARRLAHYWHRFRNPHPVRPDEPTA